MATAGLHSSFMGSVTVNGTTAQSVWALLSAVWSDLPHRCCFLQLQLDNGAGGTVCAFGNSNVSSTMCGGKLVASQTGVQMAFDSNLLHLDDIYLKLTTATEAQVNIIALVR